MKESELQDTIRGVWTPNDKVRLGLAFEKILMDPDAYLVVGGYACDGFTIDRAEMDPCLDRIDRRGVFQVKAQRAYGPHDVVVKTDQMLGATVFDWKTTTSPFNVDKYLESYQWRFTFDVLPAKEFIYQVFLLNDHGNGVVEVRGVEEVKVYPYPALSSDCADLVFDFVEYCRVRKLDGILQERQIAAEV